MTTIPSPSDLPEADPVRGVADEDRLDLTKVASWDGDRLVLHESAVEKLRRDKLSPSTAKSIGGGCPARWAGERLMPEAFDPFAANSLGSAVHEIFEDFFALPYWQRSRAEALGLLERAKNELWNGTDPVTVAKRAEWHGKVYHLMDGLWKIENPMLVRVAALEQGFSESVLVAGVPFVGYVDRTDFVTAKDGTEGTAVVDYKTGKMPDRNKIKRFGDDHGDQMRLYSEAYYQETGVRPTRATLYYTQFGKKRDAALSAPYMKKTLTDFEQAWVSLKRYEERQEFPTVVGPLCGWCPLVNTCPAAIAAGKSDQKGTAPPAGAFRIPVMHPLAPSVAGADLRGGDSFDSFDPYETADLDTTIGDAIADLAAHVDSATGPVGDGTEVPENTTTVPSPSTIQAIGVSMSHLFSEDKPWFDEAQGLVNANSYGATAAFANSSWAYDELLKANVPLSRERLSALAQTFSFIVSSVQFELSGSTTPSAGLNTRLRGALHSYMDHHPIPFGGDAAVWEAWVSKAVRNIRSIALTAHSLATETAPAQPWSALAAPDQTASAG